MAGSSDYRVASIEVTNLWGRRTFAIDFRPDVTILIGENGTGKTTLLNLLHSILTADLDALFAYQFDEAVLKLVSFSSASKRTIRISSTEEGLTFRVANRTFEFTSIGPDPRGFWTPKARLRAIRARKGLDELKGLLQGLVPFVWLPVSRRLPIPHDEDDRSRRHPTRRRHVDHLESVDARLEDLRRELREFRLRLESQVSRRHRDFEQKALRAILYSERLDSLNNLQRESPPTQEDQDQLIHVFGEANLLDDEMRERIRAHFARAQEALARLAADEGGLEDLVIMPLVQRTRSLVSWARDLRAQREEIFAPLKRYEALANEFLAPKRFAVDEGGDLHVTHVDGDEQHSVALGQLSSGEKQILILLTAALLKSNAPIVYVADEPELSLHVTWQEKLLQSLVDLGGLIQIIVATHSPDVVGSFYDNIIELRRT